MELVETCDFCGKFSFFTYECLRCNSFRNIKMCFNCTSICKECFVKKCPDCKSMFHCTRCEIELCSKHYYCDNSLECLKCERESDKEMFDDFLSESCDESSNISLSEETDDTEDPEDNKEDEKEETNATNDTEDTEDTEDKKEDEKEDEKEETDSEHEKEKRENQGYGSESEDDGSDDMDYEEYIYEYMCVDF